MNIIAIELSFDVHTEQLLLDLWGSLAAMFERSGDSELGDRPHVSLAVFRDQAPADVVEPTRRLGADTEPFPLRLGPADAFDSDEGVVYLHARPVGPLRRVHRRLMQLLGPDAALVDRYYLPEVWQPHCTVATGVPRERIREVVQAADASGRPINCVVARVTVVAYGRLASGSRSS